ncbi:MAG: substrate-binding domain-containing protein [Bilifractor sp.]|jgi:ribose transport system substrate-binding protein|nr:substrate-binding domain-containing protein [Lachnospiraceae bacterium]
MKQKVVASLVSAAMVATLFAGCGSSSTSTSTSAASSAAASSAASSSSAAEESTSSSAAEETSSSSAATSASSEAVESTSASSSSSSSDSGWTNLDQFDGLKANDAYEFPVIVKSFQSTYWQAALKGMDQAASELGVTYSAQGPNAESDIADQVNMLNTAISSNPKGIALAACDTSSVIESLQTCADKNIPVVAFDTGIDDAPEGSMACTVVTDNTAAGATAADGMWEAIKDTVTNATDPVRIGEVSQDATALNIQQRTLGFINEMISLVQGAGKTVAVTGNEFYVDNAEGADADEGSADVVIEVGVPAQTTVELCSTEAQTILSKDDTIAIFGSNQVAAEGVLAANANLSVLGSDVSAGDIIAVGFDAGSTIKGAIEDGTMYGAVTQSPLMMGYYALYALTAAANGETLKDVDAPGYWYNADNMNDDQIAPNLYD